MHKPILRLFCAAVLVCAVMAVPRPCDAFSLGFKLTGGYNSMNGGDVNEGLKGGVDFTKMLGTLLAMTVHGDYKAFHAGLDWGGDVILYFTPVIGLGIGAGMLNAQSTSEISYSGFLGSGTMTYKPEVKIVPVRAGLHFAVPMGSFVNLTLNAGAEYHLAKIKYTSREENVSGDWYQDVTEVESKGKIGFVAGLGLEIKVLPNLSIVLEGRGRYAQIDGFSGSVRNTSSSGPSYSEDGDLWYVVFDLGTLGRYPIVTLSDTPPPSDPMYQDARSARLSLNGFAAIAGIIIRI